MNFAAVSADGICTTGAHSFYSIVVLPNHVSESHRNKCKGSRVTIDKSTFSFRCSADDSKIVMCPKTSPSSTKWRLESYAVIVTHCVPVHISCLRPISTPYHLSRTSSISPRTQDRSSRAPPMGSLDTASLRSSSVSQLTRLTRTPRHPLMSRSLTCSLSRTCSGSR